MTTTHVATWLNAHCDGCGTTNPNQPDSAGPDAVARVPDDWRAIAGPILSGGAGVEPWMLLGTPGAFASRGLALGRSILGRLVLCPACLPPMAELSFEEQRALFSPQVGGFHRAEPWGPVRPGVPLPCSATRRTRYGFEQPCELEHGHSGKHFACHRYFDARAETSGPGNPRPGTTTERHHL